LTDEFFVLNPRISEERIAYERAFYDAYNQLTDNRLVRDLWLWDDEARRLRTRIHYDDQVIFGWRDMHGNLLCALAASVNPREFQAGMFGFQREPDASQRRSCEILNLITTPHLRQSAVRAFYTFVAGYGFQSLRKMGYDVGYSTCTRRRKRVYVFLGGQVLGENVIKDESRYMLLWDFHEILDAPPRR